MLEFLEFDSCCICVPLRLGCLIIGYLTLVTNILLTVLALMWIVLGLSFIANGGHAILLVVGIVMFLAAVTALTFTILLLLGLHKERPGFVKAYLMYALVFFVLNVILFITNLCTSYNAAGYIVLTIIDLIIYVYFLLVLRSYHIKMGGSNLGA